MYQYENGVKKKNVGFARVEAKNGQCKITLHMQLLGQLDSIFPTYLIQRDETNMDLIYLGDTLLRNQIMDSKLAANEENIMGSGFSLSAMGGLLLFLNDNVFFATEWDDKPIVAKEVLAALQPKEEKKAPIVVENEIRVAPEEEKQDQDKEDKQLTSKVELVKEELQQAEVRVANNIEEELLIPKYKLPRGWKTIERIQKPYDGSINKVSESVISIKPYEKNSPTEQMELIKQIVLTEQTELTESIEQTKSIKQTELTEQTEFAEQIKSAETIATTETIEFDRVVEKELSTADHVTIEEAARDVVNVRQEEVNLTSDNKNEDSLVKMNMSEGSAETDQPDHPSAMHFFDNYPRIYPFEDNEISLCVKIEPKDIGSLPKDIWALSNNSFLMHGFYCYHHLIFAKIKDRFGCRYLLGVPGIYHNRERFMAKMFGFESFKSIRRRELRQGDFGYWYLPITF
jgi:hypothetical protein